MNTTNISYFKIVFVTLATGALTFAGCKQQSFKSGSQTGRRLPGDGYATPSTGGSTGGDTASSTGTTTSPTNPEGPKCKMTIVYDSNESDDNSKWKGTYTYKLQRSGEEAVTVLSYSAGARKATKVTDAPVCKCGEENTFDLIISAGGIEQNLTSWNQEAIASHAQPTNASDWKDFLKNTPAPAAYTIYLGGFDHEFLSSNWCAGTPFSCDDRKWNNRDDSMLVFSCNVSECPGGGANTSLKFNGQDN